LSEERETLFHIIFVDSEILFAQVQDVRPQSIPDYGLNNNLIDIDVKSGGLILEHGATVGQSQEGLDGPDEHRNITHAWKSN
jgi:hypothetical protein